MENYSLLFAMQDIGFAMQNTAAEARNPPIYGRTH
jgi:hypothetical protein